MKRRGGGSQEIDPTGAARALLVESHPLEGKIEQRYQVALLPETILVQNDQLFVSSVDEKTVMLSIRAATYFTLDRVGTDIWNMLAQPRSLQQIMDSLVPLYNVDRGIMSSDVNSFLQSLIDHHLVRVV
jgi:hypothetical protein